MSADWWLWFDDDAAAGVVEQGDPGEWQLVFRADPEPWVIDQRSVGDQGDEQMSALIGMVPEHVLAAFEYSDVALADDVLKLGPKRYAPASEVAARAELVWVAIDGTTTLGVAWHCADSTLFATFWQGRLVGGLRPSATSIALRSGRDLLVGPSR